MKSNAADGDMPRESYDLLTLDVFDTCLIRDFVSQESLWHLLGHQVARRLPGVSAAGFARLRAEAENDARNRSEREDIRLREVYGRMGSVCGWDIRQQEQAVALEEELEACVLRVNPAARPLLARIREAAVCYLTDTPHRGAFIEKCLNEQGMPAGPVLSSGDLGLRKGTGALFREAMERCKAERRDILHVGNDLRTDGAGSAVARVAFGPLLEANPNRYERTLDRVTGGAAGLLGACLAGCGRALRLEQSGRFAPALLAVATGVAGPAIFAAAAWTLLSAQADGIGTLYFVSRDGEILLAAAELLQAELGLAAGIECRYLYGSRRAWHLAALGLREAVAGAGPHISLDAPLAAPGAQATAAYEATVGYLRQERMFGGGRVGLVDIGWLGHASASLVAVAAAQETQVRCYFAGGLCGRGSERAPRDSRAFLIDARGEEPKLRPALVHLLESFCAGSGGSAVGYAHVDGHWVPRLDNGGDLTARWGLAEYQALIRSYVQAACRALAKADWPVTLAELGALRPALIGNLRVLWQDPTHEEAQLWGSFPFETDSGAPGLARPFVPRDLLSYARGERPRYGPWRQAVVVRTIGGRHPWGWPRAMSARVISAEQRQVQLAKLRARLARRPEVRTGDIFGQSAKVTVRGPGRG